MKAVIMAGGKGTRLLELTNDEIPKPMAQVAGKPILLWQIECLKRNGITDICLVVGHLGEKIEDFFGDGTKFGVTLSYFFEKKPLGSAGALAHIKHFLSGDYFLLVYGDLIFDININQMEEFHKQKESYATLFVHPNSHPFDSDLVILNSESRVMGYDSKKNVRDYWYENIVNAGFFIISIEICSKIDENRKTDLEKDLIFNNCGKNSDIFGYMSSEYIKDVGTTDRILQVESDIQNGVVAAKNLTLPQKCIFFDRDGTINKHKGLIYRVDDMELEETAGEAVRKVNQSRFITGIITNQPVIARGLCEVEDVEEIHRKMTTLLGRDGAYFDFISYCPHHPDKGYPGEKPAYKIPCKCRKPEIGMITKAEKAMNIDLSRSWLIGDTTRDIQTAKNAGIRSILVKTGEAGMDKAFVAEPDMVCDDVLSAVEFVLNQEI